MGNSEITSFEEVLREITKRDVHIHVFEVMPTCLEKFEICELYGLSLHEMNKEIKPIMESVGWIKGGRQKIKPFGLRLIYQHFYGDDNGWKAFYTSKNGSKKNPYFN